MEKRQVNRRQFLTATAAGIGAAAVGSGGRSWAEDAPVIGRKPYAGPNVILVRFGGGVRRLETINPQHTYSPFFLHDLCKRGTLYPNMEIAQLEGVETSHGQGTLYILTGKYDKFKDVGGKFLGGRFESKVPTLFEYFRKQFDVPEHQTLIINGEDRTDEEFYSFSNHHLFGAQFRSNTLSLYWFKLHLLRRQLEQGGMPDGERVQKEKELREMEALDYRVDKPVQSPAIIEFWERWRAFYGESGFVNPRGDRLLTELSVRAIRELRPKMMMINYNDPDYVHWGNPSHYNRGIAVIDEGLQRLVACVEADEEYRDNTIFAIVPDCGRDSNRAIAVPFQHHFGTRSSHEIFALFFGPGIQKNRVVDFKTDQTSVATTLGHAMGMTTPFTEGDALDDVFV